MLDQFEVHIYPAIAVPILLPRADLVGQRGDLLLLRNRHGRTLRVGAYRVLHYDTHNSNTPRDFDRLIKIVGPVRWRNPPYERDKTFYALEFTGYATTRRGFLINRRTERQLKIWYVNRIDAIYEARVHTV